MKSVLKIFFAAYGLPFLALQPMQMPNRSVKLVRSDMKLPTKSKQTVWIL